jgi:glycosyltransferase involved in cell wall biosynthesis
MLLREKRIICSSNTMSPLITTVYLGIYNATQYIDSLSQQLANQKFLEFNLLVVDNGSTDDSWFKLQAWLLTFEGHITLVKNPINLGLFGSLALNRDLIKSEWFLPIHQDDYYYKNHILTHFRQIDKAKKSTVAISTDMASMRNNGRKSVSLPRASWFPVGDDSPSRFIQNLISISVPQPSTSFKTDEFFACLGPWHDWSFSDVELTLKLIAKGEFVQVKKQTMRYRENPVSQSHSITDLERKWSAAIGLARVLTSSEFSQIAKQVNTEDRKPFTEAVQQGIELRVGKSEFGEFITLLALESLAHAWNYESNEPLFNVNAQYEIVNSKNVKQFLAGVMFENGLSNPKLLDNLNSETRIAQLQRMLNVNINQIEKKANTSKKNLKIIIYQALFGLMPYRIKRYMVEKLLNVAINFGFKHRWNFTWK